MRAQYLLTAVAYPPRLCSTQVFACFNWLAPRSSSSAKDAVAVQTLGVVGQPQLQDWVLSFKGMSQLQIRCDFVTTFSAVIITEHAYEFMWMCLHKGCFASMCANTCIVQQELWLSVVRSIKQAPTLPVSRLSVLWRLL